MLKQGGLSDVLRSGINGIHGGRTQVYFRWNFYLQRISKDLRNAEQEKNCLMG